MVALLLFLAMVGGCGLPSASSPPEDVYSVISNKCSGCHGEGRLAVPLFPALGPLMIQKIDARLMPPGQPSADSPQMVHDPRLTQREVELFHRWRDAGFPAGIIIPLVRNEDADAFVEMSAAYKPTENADSFRCFYLPSGNLRGQWISGTAWSIGNPPLTHHIAAATLDDVGVNSAKAIDDATLGFGWPCPADWGVPVVASLGAGSITSGSFIELPRNAGIEITGGFVLQIHYVPGTGSDRSGIKLRFHKSPPPKKVVDVGVVAPSELPCPAGYSLDPNNSCSRAKAMTSTTWSVEQATKTNNALLTGCGYTLDSYYAAIPFQVSAKDHFYIKTHCDLQMPFDGELIQAGLHMHTRGNAGRISVGAIQVLRFDRYSWAWERKFALSSPIEVHKGEPLRVDCEFDNGKAAQWSAVDGMPGFDGPARPPLEPSRYLAMSYDKYTEMCVATVSVAIPR